MRKKNPYLKKWQKKFSNWKASCQPTLDKIAYACKYIAKFKKLFLGVPVATAALVMAIVNMFKLPPLVGFIQQANGEFEIEIVRLVAVLGPLAITAICLLLMFASKRTLTPWMVSVFSLLLPLMILITNTFPA